MSNFLKSLIPNIFFYIGAVFEILSKIFMGICRFFYGISVLLHMQLNTKLGKSLNEMQNQVNSIVTMFNNINSKVKSNKEAVKKEDDRLANIVKSDTNVVHLGKKNDDDTKG